MAVARPEPLQWPAAGVAVSGRPLSFQSLLACDERPGERAAPWFRRRGPD